MFLETDNEISGSLRELEGRLPVKARDRRGTAGTISAEKIRHSVKDREYRKSICISRRSENIDGKR